MSRRFYNRRPKDPTRINLNQSWVLEFWCRIFAISPEQLRSIVGKVGVRVKDIERLSF